MIMPLRGQIFIIFFIKIDTPSGLCYTPRQVETLESLVLCHWFVVHGTRCICPMTNDKFGGNCGNILALE